MHKDGRVWKMSVQNTRGPSSCTTVIGTPGVHIQASNRMASKHSDPIYTIIHPEPLCAVTTILPDGSQKVVYIPCGGPSYSNIKWKTSGAGAPPTGSKPGEPPKPT